MTNKCNCEKTTVWGDPHITSPDGKGTTVNGNFTFNLGNGTVVTCVTNNGAQDGAGVEQGTVGHNSYVTQVVVTDGNYTATLNPDTAPTVATGNNDPASQQGLQLVENNQ